MFSIKEVLKYGWQKSKENLEVVLFTTLFVLAVGAVVSQTGEGHGSSLSFLSFIATIFLIIVRIGYKKIFLRIHDGQSPVFIDLFKEYRTFWRYLGVTILTYLTILGGLILIIVPGIIWAVRFAFSPIIVVDTKSGPIVAMKESYAITKGSFSKLFLFFITIILLNILGFVLFGIGLLLTVPISTFAYIYVYRELTRKKAGLSQPTPNQPSPLTS